MKTVYLDHNSTTPIDSRVWDAMRQTSLEYVGNPASQHSEGRRARHRLDQAMDTLGGLLGIHVHRVPADRLVLTSGGTEANNMALTGLIGLHGGRVIVSSIEHPSVLGPARALTERGATIAYVGANSDGTIDLNHLDELLAIGDPPVRLVSVMLANNETGVIQPVREVVNLCDTYGVPVHTDAVQAIGKMPINFGELGVAAMTIAGHKCHGPCGIGALAIRYDQRLTPILAGGAQQLGTRPGTEPLALAVGLAACLTLASAEMESRRTHLETLRDLLERQLVLLGDHIQVNGTALRLPQVTNVSFCGRDRQSMLMALDLSGVCCSAGSACASGSSAPSHVLQAMGLTTDRIDSALRFSVGMTSTSADVHLALEQIEHLLTR